MTGLKRTPMQGRGARTKGGAFEREIVDMLHDIGFTDARRNWRSGADGGSDITGVPDTAIECKRQERVSIWDWVGQCEDAASPTEIPVVVFRRSRSRAYAVLPAVDFFTLLREVQELRAR